MNDRPIGPLGNLRRGVVARGAVSIVPAVLSVLALGGATARPAFELAEARDRFELARRRVDECRHERELWQEHRAASTLESATALAQRLRANLPAECSSLVLQGAVRLAAGDAGVQLTRLEVGIDRDAGLTQTSDVVALREVRLAGRGTREQVLRIVDELRALGFPACVNSAVLRRRSGESELDFALELGLLHLAERAAPATDGGPQEQP